MSDPTEAIELNRLSLRGCYALFASLRPPSESDLLGVFRGSFAGPGWVRALAGPALALTGLGGWCGKEFGPDGTAVNLLERAGSLERRLPMALVNELSALDGQPGLALHYAPGSPFPWPWIVDELRQISPGRLLGMTRLRLPRLQRLAFPFVLQSHLP